MDCYIFIDEAFQANYENLRQTKMIGPLFWIKITWQANCPYIGLANDKSHLRNLDKHSPFWEFHKHAGNISFILDLCSWL